MTEVSQVLFVVFLVQLFLPFSFLRAFYIQMDHHNSPLFRTCHLNFQYFYHHGKNTKMTPKTMGSTPNAVATGKRIGVMIMMDEIVSMNIPMTRSSTLINSKTIIGLSDRLVIKLANSVGMRASVIKRPNAVAIITKISMVPLVFALPASISGKWHRLMSPYTNMPTMAA